MVIRDPMAEGIKAGWRHQDAALLEKDITIEADVAIVGTGAGGGISAEVLSQAGLTCVLVEEGPLKTTKDFQMREADAYPNLYQESAGRKTKDKAVNILQGRCVGGGTTVNWTSSFNTPEATLKHWQDVHQVADCQPEQMAPWFEKVKQRLNIHPWPAPPNANNEALKKGAEHLGWSYQVMNRNVKACGNLGYCGVGCPLNAKQSTLITCIPEALRRGATLFSRTRAQELVFKGDRVEALDCVALDDRGVFPTGRRIQIRARHFVLAAGAIGSPALLLRSRVPDPFQRVGKRTFLHPVNITTAMMPDKVEPWQGAPQSIYSDHFLWPEDRADGPMGYKLEVPPLHPLLSSTVLQGFGNAFHKSFAKFPYMQAMLALCRDGFHPESQGGEVLLRDDTTPLLDYQFNDFIWDAMRRSYLSMAELQFAAGAKSVLPIHRAVTKPWRTMSEARRTVAELEMAPLQTRVFSAHVMGGCAMGEDFRQAVVGGDGRHHHLVNLSVLDGSVFPTSIGSNPQVSIFGMSLKNATKLVERLALS